MRRSKTLLLATLAWLLVPASPASANGLCRQVQAVLEEGDLLFTRLNGPLFERVAHASKGWVSHVGIALRDEDRWVVAESKVPLSKRTPLCDFVARTKEDHIAVRRLRQQLSEDEVRAIHAEANRRMGIPYDSGFDLNSERQYCSKFVYQIYQASPGVELGVRQRLSDLLANIEDTPYENDIWFWRLWFRGNIPWSRELVLPQSQYEDDDLATVFENSPATSGHKETRENP